MEKEILPTLYEFCNKKHGHEMQEFFDNFAEEFPYYVEGLNKEEYIRSFIDWLVLEKILPQTGKRITEEYVQDRPELDKETKQKILNTKGVIASQFVVIAKTNMKLKIKNMKGGEYYNILLRSKNPQIQPNTIIVGRIFPYGAIYQFAGTMFLTHTPVIVDPDIMMHMYEEKEIERAENIIISPHTKLTAILNKCPASWVDGMCQEFSITKRVKNEKVKAIENKVLSDLNDLISTLSEDSKKALKLILDNGGFVKYGKLKGFDDEVGLWWSEHPPTSSIGILRLCGLIVVGKMPFGGRLYKVALIPNIIQEKLKEIF
jgi:hypothetical protein